MDGRDNDEDLLIDCDDPECLGTLSCGPSLLFEEGIATRILYMKATPECSTSSCLDFPTGRCTLSIEGSGVIRIPIEQQKYERCLFEASLLYESETDSCTTLNLNTESVSITGGCLESAPNIVPLTLEGDDFGNANSFISDGLRIKSTYEHYEVDHYRWDAPIQPYYTR
jgi:hypothetical protein